jgi:hypothetical protein
MKKVLNKLKKLKKNIIVVLNLISEMDNNLLKEKLPVEN